MRRKQAKANVQIDNERIRVIEYSCNDSKETGFHVHQCDYIVVPQTNGQLLLIDDKGEEKTATPLKGQSYYRQAGVFHNVINNGNEKLVFTEIEIKAYTI